MVHFAPHGFQEGESAMGVWEKELTPEESERYRSFRNTLFDCLLKKESVEEVIQHAVDTFNCPIILTTSAYKVIVLNNGGFTVDDPVWKMAAGTGYCDAKSIALFESEGVTRLVLSSDGSVVLDSGLADEIPRILQKIYVFGRVGAYIGILQAGRPFTKPDLFMCDLLCEVLSVLFERDPGILRSNLTIKDSILADLISGDINSATLLNDRLRAASWKTEGHFTCALITPEKSSTGIDNADYLTDLLKRELIGSQVIRVPEGLLLILNYGSKNPFPKHSAFLAETAKKYGLYMNISGSFDNLIFLKDYYALCCRMHRTSKRIGITERLIFFDRIAAVMFTENLEKNERRTFCQTAFRELASYDRTHDTAYCETLIEYIESG